VGEGVREGRKRKCMQNFAGETSKEGIGRLRNKRENAFNLLKKLQSTQQ
jgi:hypothetical protein